LSYVLITPIKDESENLPQLKTTILNQTLLPVIWVAVVGCSKDRSFHRAEHLFRDYEWIRIILQQHFCEGGDSYKNMTAAINEGYACAKKQCADRHLTYSYVGKKDMTPILCPDSFEILYDEMERDPKLAFACGIERLNYGGKVKEVRAFSHFSNMANTNVRHNSKDFLMKSAGIH
jgi:biofilm PGA synthesis N-glycosyltransferase PgaC